MMDNLLSNALDIGLMEETFWNLSIAELRRMFESYKRKQQSELRMQATNTYTLARMIVNSIVTAFDSANDFPEIEDVYPSLFEKQQQIDNKTKKSIANFMAFASSFNERFKNG